MIGLVKMMSEDTRSKIATEVACWICASPNHQSPKTMDFTGPLHCIALNLAEIAGRQSE